MDWLPNDSTTLTESALLYATHGFRVIPVWYMKEDGTCACGKCEKGSKHAGKHPMLGAWQKKASSDKTAVLDARRGKPQANIGLVMGGTERLIAVDIDGPKGRASIEALGHGMPETLTSRSGRDDGGAHYIFRLKDGQDIKRIGNQAGKVLEGVDVRAENGFIVAAPSVHHTGRRYAWTNRTEIAELPDWLYEALTYRPLKAAKSQPAQAAMAVGSESLSCVADARVKAYIAAALKRACSEVSARAEGGRNDLLFTQAVEIFDFHVYYGLDHVAAWGELSSAGTACGLPLDEVSGVMSNAWRRASSGSGKAVPPAPPKLELIQGGGENVGGGPGWRELLFDDPNHPLPCEANAIVILSHDPIGETLAFNTFEQRLYYKGEAISDDAETGILSSLQKRFHAGFSLGCVRNAMLFVGMQRKFDSLLDHIEGLKWDGVSRIDDWLVKYLHAPDELWSRIVARKWLIQAVARAVDPGCQADATLTLTGEGGVGKSTMARILGGPFYTDEVADLGSKDAAMQLQGKWIFELAENDAADRANLQRLKAWLTRRVDRYRPTYGRNVVEAPRRCVFIATTNEDTFLRDETGNRRWWPVAVHGMVDTEGLRAARDQLLAEARALLKGGASYELTPEEKAIAREKQEERREIDEWQIKLEKWVALHRIQDVRIADCLIHLGLEVGRWTRADQMRVARALTAMGLKRVRLADNSGIRHWIYKV